jgi:hypothetical protein
LVSCTAALLLLPPPDEEPDLEVLAEEAVLAADVLVEAVALDAVAADDEVFDDAADELLRSTGFKTWVVEALDEIALINMVLSLH